MAAVTFKTRLTSVRVAWVVAVPSLAAGAFYRKLKKIWPPKARDLLDLLWMEEGLQ